VKRKLIAGFEEGNIEEVMDVPHGDGQFEFVNLETDALEDFEGSRPPPIELLGGTESGVVGTV
jgi:hypothetical protein